MDRLRGLFPGKARKFPELDHVPDGCQGALSLLSPYDLQGHSLPGKAVAGLFPPGVEPHPRNWNWFQSNREFRIFLQECIARHGPNNPGLKEAARQQGTGWVYIIDARHPDPGGRVGVKDILGGFEVQNGELTGNYVPNDSHQLYSDRGLFGLEAWMHDRLMEELKALID